MSVKVAFLQLSDCWGCHQSFLDAARNCIVFFEKYKQYGGVVN